MSTPETKQNNRSVTSCRIPAVDSVCSLSPERKQASLPYRKDLLVWHGKNRSTRATVLNPVWADRCANPRQVSFFSTS